MGKDYYQILGLGRSATEEDIKKAYKKLALRWHPDRNMDKKEEAEKKFKEIALAYEILSDPQKRQLYDQYGEEAFQGGGGGGGGMPQSSAEFAGAFPGRTFFFRSTNPRGAEEIFKEFFGSRNMDDPFASHHRSRTRGRMGDEGPSSFTFSTGSSGTGGFNGFGGFPGGFPTSTFEFEHAGPGSDSSDDPDFEQQQQQNFDGRGGFSSSGFGGFYSQQPAVLKRKLLINLEELYTGCIKRLKVTRTKLDQTKEERILTVDVKPGWKSGTKVTFNDAGDEIRPGLSQALVFEIEEKPHPQFQRNGDDLHTTLNISLSEALSGFQKGLTSLDNRVIPISSHKEVEPGQKMVVAGEGMPLFRNPQRKGDLIITFNILWPKNLSPEQKSLLRDILGLYS